MYCKYCGERIRDNAKFCPACGKPTGVTARQSGQQNQQQAYRQQAYGQQNRQAYGQQTYGQQNRQAYGQQVNWQRNPSYDSTQMILSVIGPQREFSVGTTMVFIGFVSAFISLFLPFYTANISGYTGGITLMDMDNSIWLVVLLVVILVLNLFRLYVGDLIGGVLFGFVSWNIVSNIEKVLGTVDAVGNVFGTQSLSSMLGGYSIGFLFFAMGTIWMIGGAVLGLFIAVTDYRDHG